LIRKALRRSRVNGKGIVQMKQVGAGSIACICAFHEQWRRQLCN
jgi:hypothetical protein